MKKISDRAEFFIFLLEKYAEAKNMPAKDVLNFWKEKDIVDYINDMYELYHIERIENAIQDIDRKCDFKTSLLKPCCTLPYTNGENLS